MKRNWRVVLYIILGVVFLAAAAAIVFVGQLQHRPWFGLAGLLFTAGMVLLLLAKITRMAWRIQAIEEFQRLESCRERARSHGSGEGEEEETDGV